jgi:hypothetical protein
MKKYALMILALGHMIGLDAQQTSTAKKATDVKKNKIVHYLSVYNTGARYALVQAPFGAKELKESIIKPMALATDFIEVELNEATEQKPLDITALRERSERWLKTANVQSDDVRSKKTHQNTEGVEETVVASQRTCMLQTDNVKDQVALIHYDKACDMTFKCLQAQKAGAMMAIVIHPTNNSDSLILKGGRYSDSLKIACFSITQSQGDSIRAMLPSYVGIFKPEIKPDVTDSTQMVKKDLIAFEVLNNDIGSIALSPNPARDMVSITYQLQDVPEAKMEVVNSMGQVTHRQILRGGASGTLDIDIQRWGNGVYIVELSYGEKVMRQKLIVQH